MNLTVAYKTRNSTIKEIDDESGTLRPSSAVPLGLPASYPRLAIASVRFYRHLGLLG